MKLLLFLSLIFSTIHAFADDSINLDKVSIQSSDFVWNKWDTDNFIILSIDKSQGLKIKNSIEKIKSNFEKKWGIKQSEFAIPCKVLCVNNSELLNRFFSISESKSEVRKDNEGNILVSAIWLDFDSSISHLVADVCLENSSNNLFLKRGITRLEQPIDLVKFDLSQSIDADVAELIAVSEKDWIDFSIQEKDKFDRESAFLCLMLRKEFGINKFSLFVNSMQDENSLLKIYKFSNSEDLSKTLNRYSKNLSNDISKNLTPDYYLK